MAILKSSTVAALDKGLLRLQFADDAMEAEWMAHRLTPFRKTNRISAIFFLVMIFTFTGVDVVAIQVEFWDLFIRASLLASGFFMLGSIKRIKTLPAGDWLLFASLLVIFPVCSFGLFLKLPLEIVEEYWMVTTALGMIILFVVIDIALPFRLVLSVISFVSGMAMGLVVGLSDFDMIVSMLHIGFVFCGSWMAAWQVEASRRLAFANQLQIVEEKDRTESLLRNILPNPIADQLLDDPGTIAEKHDDVTVIFADIVGFTPFSAGLDAERVVEFLDRVFSEFDKLCDQYGVEKIKTIGDAYMAAGSVPTERGNHVQMVVELGLDMLKVLERYGGETGDECQLRIGIHCGPVVAGVIGRRKFIYDLWGDTVNTASRMESHGVPGCVQVSEAILLRLDEQFAVEPRGLIQVKGKGSMPAFLVRRQDAVVTS